MTDVYQRSAIDLLLSKECEQESCETCFLFQVLSPSVCIVVILSDFNMIQCVVDYPTMNEATARAYIEVCCNNAY